MLVKIQQVTSRAMYKLRNLHFTIAPTLLICSTLACGGGGGGSDTPSPQPVVPPVTDSLGSLYLDMTSNLPNGLTGACMDAVVGDFDDDGDLDLILAMESVNNILLENNGSANFNLTNPFSPSSRDSEDMTVGDFDNDGDIDVVFVSEDDLINEYYINDGSGNFTDVTGRIPVNGISNAVESFDVNNDGYLDLIIGNNGINNLLLNDGSGAFIDDTANTDLGGRITQDLEAADVDNDGDLDLLMGNETFNEIYINNGDGSFSNESGNLFPGITAETRDLELGDVDNDGDLDLLVSNVTYFSSLNSQNYLLINDGSGAFSRDNSFSVVGNHVDSSLVDLDGDGDLDILTGTANLTGSDGNNQSFENDGGGVFTSSDFSGSGNLFDIAEGDFNGDGEVDFYFCNRFSQDRLYISD